VNIHIGLRCYVDSTLFNLKGSHISQILVVCQDALWTFQLDEVRHSHIQTLKHSKTTQTPQHSKAQAFKPPLDLHFLYLSACHPLTLSFLLPFE
jgi:hypothetical protein